MKASDLIQVLLASGVIHKAGDDNLLIDLTHFNEYGKFVIGKVIDSNGKCPHCGKFDHEDGGCTIYDEA